MPPRQGQLGPRTARALRGWLGKGTEGSAVPLDLSVVLRGAALGALVNPVPGRGAKALDKEAALAKGKAAAPARGKVGVPARGKVVPLVLEFFAGRSLIAARVGSFLLARRVFFRRKRPAGRASVIPSRGIAGYVFPMPSRGVSTKHRSCAVMKLATTRS